MALCLKYMLRTLSCSSILPRQDEIVRILLSEYIHLTRLTLIFLEGLGNVGSLGTKMREVLH